MNTTTQPKKRLYATINCVDGKQRNLGRIDGRFKPRLWYYKYVTFPILKRKYQKDS